MEVLQENYHNYERILQERAYKKRGGVKHQQRIIQIRELLKVRRALKNTALSEHLGDRDQLIADFLRIYLLRISEVVSLNTKAFDWERRQFTIYAYYEKNAKEKVYPLDGAPQWFLKELGHYIKTYRHTFKNGYLFPSLSYQSKERPYIKACTWTAGRWNKAVHAAGVSKSFIGKDGRVYEQVRSHSFRKAGITDLIKKRVPIKKIAAFTHQHPVTVMNYYNMVEEEAARKEIMTAHISRISLDH